MTSTSMLNKSVVGGGCRKSFIVADDLDASKRRSSCGSFTGVVTQHPQLKCVVVGDGGVGKTSMLLRFVHGDMMEEYSPTYFDSFQVTMATADNEWNRYSMTLIDTAGQETYDRIRTLTYSEADVFILCFSVTCPDSFTNVKSRWLPELKSFRPKTPIILVGTQTDLRSSPNNRNSTISTTFNNRNSTFSTISSRSSISLSQSTHGPSFISYRKGKRLADKIHAKMYAECSALRGEGLDPIFYKALSLATCPKKKSKFWSSLKRTLTLTKGGK